MNVIISSELEKYMKEVQNRRVYLTISLKSGAINLLTLYSCRFHNHLVFLLQHI